MLAVEGRNGIPPEKVADSPKFVIQVNNNAKGKIVIAAKILANLLLGGG